MGEAPYRYLHAVIQKGDPVEFGHVMTRLLNDTEDLGGEVVRISTQVLPRPEHSMFTGSKWIGQVIIRAREDRLSETYYRKHPEVRGAE